MDYLIWLYGISVVLGAFFNKDAIKRLYNSFKAESKSHFMMERFVITVAALVTTFCPVVNTCFVLIYVTSYINDWREYR